MAIIARDQVTLAVAVDVLKVETWYKLQASTAAAPTKPSVANPSGWSTTEPAYDGTSTNTLYTCQCTTLTDNTFFWGSVCISSSYEAAKQAWNKADNAEDAAELALGQTVWFATCSTAASTVAKVATITPATTSFELKDGVTVKVKFSVTNTGAVANLTLNVNGTGAKGIRTQRNNAIANLNHAGILYKDVIIAFTYNGTYWLADENANTTYNMAQVLYSQAVKANMATYTGTHLIVGGQNGYQNIAAGVAFDLAYPILYYATAATTTIAEGSTANNHFLSVNNVNFSINGTIENGEAYKTLWLKGFVSDGIFTIADSPFMTTTVPSFEEDASAEDGRVYAFIPLGVLSSATSGRFVSSSQLHAFIGGTFQPVQWGAMDVANSAREAATSARISADGAASVANAINQHFWTSESESDAGAHITEVTKEEWASANGKRGPNSLWNSIGMLFRDGLTNILALVTGDEAGMNVYDGLGNQPEHIVARFSKSGTQIGSIADDVYITIDTDSVDFHKSGTVIAQAKVDGFSAPNLTASEKLAAGEWAWVPKKSNGHISLKYLGKG